MLRKRIIGTMRGTMTTAQVASALRLFGTPIFSQNGKELVLPVDKRHQLLAYLAYRGTWVSRESLADMFWTGPTDTVRGNLRSLLGRTNELTWLTGLEVERARVRWPIPTDVAAFQRALAAEHIDDALEVYSGPLLENFEGYDDSDFATWLEVERELIHGVWRKALIARVEEHVKNGNYALATSLLPALLRHDPFDEEGMQLYLRYASKGGQERQALSTYGTFAVRLERELGVKPSSATLELIERLERSLASKKSGRQLLGDQRTRKLDMPTPALPTNPTVFVGRDVELAEIANTLGHAERRLLTLLGPGGAGKTRLALQAANELQQTYEDGVAFVALESVTDPDTLMFRVADTLGVSLSTQNEPLSQIKEAVGDRQLLLVLDNFEHLTDAAEQLPVLLAACPRFKLLVTSRERLRLDEEHTLLLGGLALPQGKESLPEAETFDSIHLFVERAKRVSSSFILNEYDLPHVLQICRLVEGLPLGIELAAAWIRALPCAEIASEIAANLDFLESISRNANERQRSIRATLTYSWSLLSDREREVLANLSVFHGGFTREAAAFVANANLVLLSALLDKSLLRLQSGRYSFHPLVQTFASEKLVQARHEYEARHAAYFMTRAQQPPSDMAWVFVKTELANLSAAARWSARNRATRDVKLAAPLLLSFFEMSGRYLDGATLFRELLDLVNEDADDGCYGTLLVCHGKLLYRLGDTEGAERLARRGLEGLRLIDDSWGMVTSLNMLGNLAKMRTRTSEALGYYREALGIAERDGPARTIGGIMVNIGTVEVLLGDLEAARQHYEQGLALDRQENNLWAVCIDLLNLGNLLYNMDELGAADEYLREGVDIAEKTGAAQVLPVLQINLGAVAFKRERYDDAQAHYQKTLELARESGAKANEAGALVALGRLHLIRSDRDAAWRDLLEGLKLAEEVEDTSEVIGALVGLAALRAELDPFGALTILNVAARQEEAMPDTKIWAKTLLEEQSAVAPAEVREQAESKGRALSLEGAVALVLEGR